MADEITITLQDVRREKRQRRDGKGEFETLTLVGNNDIVYSGYVNSYTVVPHVGDTVHIFYQECEGKSEFKYNTIVSFSKINKEETQND